MGCDDGILFGGGARMFSLGWLLGGVLGGDGGGNGGGLDAAAAHHLQIDGALATVLHLVPAVIVPR